MLFNTEFLYFYLLSKNVEIKIYKTLVLLVVFYGCEASSLALMEEHRLRAFENRVLRRIFGARRTEGRGVGENCITRSLRIFTLHQVIQMIKSNSRWAEHATCIGEKRNAFKVLVRKP